MVNQKTQYCVRCVLPDTFPKISFNAEGICNYCLRMDKYLDPEDLKQKNKILIQEKIDEARAAKRPYDALLCYSGGKDSTYTLIQAKEKYGLNVLAFTLDNGFLSDLAVPNIHTVVNRLGVDHIFFKPAKEDITQIFRAAATKDYLPESMATRISSICYSCISIVNTTAFNMSVEKGIPLILAGFNLGQIPMNAVVYRYHPATIAEFRQLVLDKLLQDSPKGYRRYFEFTETDVKNMPWYLNPMAIESISDEEIIKVIQGYGWRLPKDVDSCSTNCRLNQLANCLHKKRFQFSPYALELAVSIGAGSLNREDALEKLAHDFNPVEVKHLAEELGIHIDV